MITCVLIAGIPYKIRGTTLVKSSFDPSKHPRNGLGQFSSIGEDDFDFSLDDFALEDFEEQSPTESQPNFNLEEIPSQHHKAVKRFLSATDNMTNIEAFDAAYESLSEEIPDFDEFEQISMILGLA